MDEHRHMNPNPNNILQKIVSKVYKHTTYKIVDSVTVQLVTKLGEFENTLSVKEMRKNVLNFSRNFINSS